MGITMARWHTLFALAASCAVLISASPVSPDLPSRADPVVNQTKCDGRTFTYQQLAGYGFVASDARDKFGDTLGGYGSAIALDKKAWKRTGDGKYAGVLYALPDRGCYVKRNPRIKKISRC